MPPGRDHDRELDDTLNSEAERYAYDFDLEVMHPLMMRSFEPFFRDGPTLELGGSRGDFTSRLLARFGGLTSVDASQVAIDEANARFGNRVELIHGTFESVILGARFDNIVMTHALEHLDDPVGVLRRVNDEWLTDRGRLLLVVPNANAPSRQIAVYMGLIENNAAVTAAEAGHGHRRTYSLDTLERDVVDAGLSVIHRSGVFFKALANFQWDRLLRTDIISEAYLEGCYKLGQRYPDLCASLFLVCERGMVQ